jgi:hypothetical protein
MWKAHRCLQVVLFVLIGHLCYSQSPVKVSDPVLEMVGNIIHISYDILNSDPDKKYTISMVIKDEDGNIINARALNGDIGEEVSGGSNKQISWNLEADNIFIDAYIFVQINAKLIPPPAPIIVEPEEEMVQEEKQEIPKEDASKEVAPSTSRSTNYNRTGIILQSIALPGLGLSRVTGKPHWIKGVAGYGCVAGSIILYSQAVSTYNGIEDLLNFDEINAAYDKAIRKSSISKGLTYASIGIWITDFIWTMVGTSDLKKPYSAELGGLSIGSNIDPLSNVPMVCVNYRF